jgi:hypothetical protein
LALSFATKAARHKRCCSRLPARAGKPGGHYGQALSLHDQGLGGFRLQLRIQIDFAGNNLDPSLPGFVAVFADRDVVLPGGRGRRVSEEK